MLTAVAIWCLLLTAGVLLLYVMVGELASTAGFGSGAADNGASRPTYQEYEEPKGRSVNPWPDSWKPLPQGSGRVLALSTVCSSCQEITQNREALRSIASRDLLVVISAASRSSAAGMVAAVREFEEDLLGVHVDEHGDWLRHACGVDTSPTILFVRESTITSAYNVSSAQSVIELSRVEAGSAHSL
jgi:hypothetical protein